MINEVLLQKLAERKAQDAFRQLRVLDGCLDFCSNDYLGISKNNLLETALLRGEKWKHGSTGSRLLSGNYALIEQTEKNIALFHRAEAGLLFNSGYDANLGLLSAVPGRGDTIFYDQLSHASIRDGIRLSFAHAVSFAHNDVSDLEAKLQKTTGCTYVVTESVFSMDGDEAPLEAIAAVCERYSAFLIVDEAHATGIIGARGEGLVQHLGLEAKCFARVHTFGKACGAHGAIILGSQALTAYLINFCRPFIFTTALPETAVAAIAASYQLFPGMVEARNQLDALIGLFREAVLPFRKLNSYTPIQGVVIPGNGEVKRVAGLLQERKLDVRPILYPSVPKGGERLRIVLHAFNTPAEVTFLIDCLIRAGELLHHEPDDEK